jgi:hypothetical protein
MEHLWHKKSYLVVEIATTIIYLFAKFKPILPLIGLVWVIMVKRAAPSLRSNIPQTALVADLDTYDFVIVFHRHSSLS